MRKRLPPNAQRGVTMLVVLVLLSVMLLGGLALARLTEVGTLGSGNVSYHEVAMQASEVGLNTAFAAVKALSDEDVSISPWYSATSVAKDSDGVPSVDWSTVSSTTVGQMKVQYVAERACDGSPVIDILKQCLLKQKVDKEGSSRQAGEEKPPPVTAKQFRITVRVTGPKGTQTFVQSLVTRGST